MKKNIFGISFNKGDAVKLVEVTDEKEATYMFDCAKWLTEFCYTQGQKLPDWVIQSQNPVGRNNINQLLSTFRLKYDKS